MGMDKETRKKIYGERKDPLTGELFVPNRSNQKFASKENQTAYNNLRANEKRAKEKQKITSDEFNSDNSSTEYSYVQIQNRWQLCPKCYGAISISGYECNICNGHGIISIIDGKPPKVGK